METYKEYLRKRHFSESSIQSYTYQIKHFLHWCKHRKTTPETLNYSEALIYIAHLQKPNKNGQARAKKTINHKLSAVKKYLNYLVAENYRVDNPIASTTVRGTIKHIHHNILSAEELEELYYSFETENSPRSDLQTIAKRNKIIVGLLVYQGLTTTNLKSLRLQDIDLKKGKLYACSHKKSNGRTIDLKPWQIIELHEYIKEIHPQLTKAETEEETLALPNIARLSNTVQSIVKKLKKTRPKVENSQQLRASVITHWLKQYNLRKVQYLAGHRYISSTEKYVQDDLENLHEMINNFHPIS